MLLADDLQGTADGTDHNACKSDGQCGATNVHYIYVMIKLEIHMYYNRNTDKNNFRTALLLSCNL